MFTATEIAEFRADARSRMGVENEASDCRIARINPDDPKTTNPDGFEVPNWVAIHTGAPFRLGGSTRDGATRSVRVGDVELVVAVRTGHLPHDTADLHDLDIIQVTAGENTGHYFRIIEATWQDQATARRVPVYEVSKPDGWPW